MLYLKLPPKKERNHLLQSQHILSILSSVQERQSGEYLRVTVDSLNQVAVVGQLQSVTFVDTFYLYRYYLLPLLDTEAFVGVFPDEIVAQEDKLNYLVRQLKQDWLGTQDPSGRTNQELMTSVESTVYYIDWQELVTEVGQDRQVALSFPQEFDRQLQQLVQDYDSSAPVSEGASLTIKQLIEGAILEIYRSDKIDKIYHYFGRIWGEGVYQTYLAIKSAIKESDSEFTIEHLLTTKMGQCLKTFVLEEASVTIVTRTHGIPVHTPEVNSSIYFNIQLYPSSCPQFLRSCVNRYLKCFVEDRLSLKSQQTRHDKFAALRVSWLYTQFTEEETKSLVSFLSDQMKAGKITKAQTSFFNSHARALAALTSPETIVPEIEFKSLQSPHIEPRTISTAELVLLLTKRMKALPKQAEQDKNLYKLAIYNILTACSDEANKQKDVSITKNPGFCCIL